MSPRDAGGCAARSTPTFGAALYGALREARDQEGDLHVNLSGVEFVDLAFTQTLFLTAHSVTGHRRLVLHGVAGFMRRILETVRRPGRFYSRRRPEKPRTGPRTTSARELHRLGPSSRSGVREFLRSPDHRGSPDTTLLARLISRLQVDEI